MEIGGSRIDKAMATGGVWQDYVLETPDGSEQLSLCIALADVTVNEAYKNALKAAMSPFDRMLAIYQNGSNLPTKVAAEINDATRKVFAQVIIVDWKGPTKNGEPMPYSWEACLELFKTYPEVFAQVEKDSVKYSRYRVAVLDEAAKN